MKKLLFLLFIIPLFSLAQNDSVELKNKSIGEILNNKIPNPAIDYGFRSEIIKIDSVIISEKQKFPGIVCAPSLRHYKEPLYVIDGKIVDNTMAEELNLVEIASVTILKDASATAIYGNRGRNGVVIINTKQYLEELEAENEFHSDSFIDYAEGITIPEYDLAVSDLGYEIFLSMQPSARSYSLNYLQNKNRHYVSVWNQRVISGNPEIYEMPIDYDSQTYYGLDFEYKLFMFFKFMESKYSISFL